MQQLTEMVTRSSRAKATYAKTANQEISAQKIRNIRKL